MQACRRRICAPLRGYSKAEFEASELERLFSLRRAHFSRGWLLDMAGPWLAGLFSMTTAERPPRMVRSAFFIAFALLLALPASAQPLPEEPLAEPVRREILAVYDSREEARPDQTRIHRFAEMTLNHLGFIVSYWDINSGLPSAERTARIRGVITWFRRAPPSLFYLWGLDQLAHGTRMVVLGDSGLSGNAPLADANRMFREIGFGLSGASIDITYATKVLYRDALIGFERELDPVLPAFPIVGTLNPEVSSHLILQHRDGDLIVTSSVVLTSNRGGYAASGYFVYEEPATGRTKWLINPFAFFQKAFGGQGIPIPDVTTLSGRRLWFSHIDGDGWNNVSNIEEYHDKSVVAAGVVLRELIAPYPDLPTLTSAMARPRRDARPRASSLLCRRSRLPRIPIRIRINGASSKITIASSRSASLAPTSPNGKPCWATVCAGLHGACFRELCARRLKPIQR
jgi:hypothetical protein